jgi:putative alpha-1,2-mannosidase
MALCKGATQGGSNADVVLAESYIKKIPGVNWSMAYEAVLKDAEIQPFNWLLEGRGGLDSWKDLGYVAKDDCSGVGYCTRSVSRAVEYGFNDYCISQMARDMGKTSDYKKYLKRSENWVNLFNNETNSTINGRTFTGFLQPRWLNKSWDDLEPTLCSPRNFRRGCYLVNDGLDTYEGSSWLYTLFVFLVYAFVVVRVEKLY